MDDAAKKAREEYLKKYLSTDDKKSGKKHKKKKKTTRTGLKIHEDDAFADVKQCAEQASSDDDSGKDVEILKKIEKLQSEPKFKPAAFEVVEFKTEANAARERHDSSSDENDENDEIAVPTTSELGKSASVNHSIRSTEQKVIGQTSANPVVSLPGRKIKDEPLDSDSSPPRRPANSTGRNSFKDEDHLLSKRTKFMNGLQSDVSSPRRKIKDEPLDSDPSPPRRPTNNDGDSDASPPRRKKRTSNSDSDLSPPRKRNDDAGLRSRGRDFGNRSHQKRRHSGSVDKKTGRDSDASSDDKSDERRGRRRRRERGRSSSRCHGHYEGQQQRRDSWTSHRGGRDGADEKDVKPVFAKSAGLKTLEERREEIKRLQEDETKLLESWEGSGKDMATVRRAKLTGKGRETKEDREKKEREAKKQQELEEKYKKWNKGLRQLEERTEKLNEMARVAQEDFARHVDDEAMNEHLKKQLHEKDPMYKYVKKKKENAEMKSGTAYPKYKGSWPPNRFNIAPGYRWDGVNRSNGFEDRIAEIANRKVAQRTEYYENLVKYEV